MSYTFVPHISSLGVKQAGVFADAKPIRSFALVELPQWVALKKNRSETSLKQLVPDASSQLLFDGYFSASALPLSPILLQLSDTPEIFEQQVMALDSTCQLLPIMSIINSSFSLEELTAHLQSLLRVTADGTSYLLRLADTQMMAAANVVLSPAQRTSVYMNMTHWWVADYQGRLHNLADGSRAQPAADLPLQWSAEQTFALLDAARAPMLASQVRALESPFGQRLTHAEQIAFVSDSIAAAQGAGIVDENEFVTWTLRRWQDTQQRSA